MKKNKFIAKVFLFFVALKNKLAKKYDKFVEPEPVVKAEYIGKVVYLLRRDFKIEDQNEIVLEIAKKLNELREEDMTVMAMEYDKLVKESSSFRGRLAVN